MRRDGERGKEWNGDDAARLVRAVATGYPGDEGFEDTWEALRIAEMERGNGWDLNALGSVLFSMWRTGGGDRETVEKIGERVMQFEKGVCEGSTAARILFCLGGMRGGERVRDRAFER